MMTVKSFKIIKVTEIAALYVNDVLKDYGDIDDIVDLRQIAAIAHDEPFTLAVYEAEGSPLDDFLCEEDIGEWPATIPVEEDLIPRRAPRVRG